jgi:hypothetical protein
MDLELTERELQVLCAVEAHWRVYSSQPTYAGIERLIGAPPREHIRHLRERWLLSQHGLVPVGEGARFVAGLGREEEEARHAS